MTKRLECCRQYAMGLPFCIDCPAALPALDPKERELLEWLSNEEYSQYGECYGSTLDSLIAKGLAQVHGPGEFQSGFIAQDPTGSKGKMYLAVSLTEAGRVALRL